MENIIPSIIEAFGIAVIFFIVLYPKKLNQEESEWL